MCPPAPINPAVTLDEIAAALSGTRAQIVTFLWRAAGSPVVNYAMNMSDVPEGSYYAEAVRWALSEGITTGTTENTFSPDSECTRAQAVAFLFRYAVSEAVTLQELVSGFSDADSVPGYALPAMNWALAEEIVQGNGSKLYEIALSVGYSDVAHLSKAFKTIEGISPGQYKAQLSR